MSQSTALVMLGVEREVGGEEDLPNECFVCTESVPVPLKSSCLCTDRYIHTDCFVKLLVLQSNTKCSVCASPYGNLRVRTLRSMRARSPCGYITLLIVSILILVGICTNTWFAMQRTGHSSPILWAAIGMMAAAVISALLFVANTLRVFGARGVVKSCVTERYVVCVCVEKRPDVATELVAL